MSWKQTISAAVLVTLNVVVNPSLAQPVRERPSDIANVGVDEHLGESLPLERVLVDSTGRRTTLGQLFDGKRPVILSFNYSDCPMLCKLQLNGLVEALKQSTLTAGEDFQVVSISIDATETPAQAAIAQLNHVRAYGRPESADGWHFLVGEPATVREIADSAGFRYQYLPGSGEYSHAAATIICTPDGEISQYLYGVSFDLRLLEDAINQAAEGEVGSPLKQLILYCFHYDEATGRYSPIAWNIMRVGAAATVFLLAALLAPLWIRSLTTRKRIQRALDRYSSFDGPTDTECAAR